MNAEFSGEATPFKAASLWTLAFKELRETLRDRRTLMTLLLMPVLVYPLMGLVLQGFFLPSFAHSEAKFGYLVVLDTEQDYLNFQLSLPTNRRYAITTASPRLPDLLEPNGQSPQKSGPALEDYEPLEYVLLEHLDLKNRPKSIEDAVSSGVADVGVKLVQHSSEFTEWTLIVRDGSANSQHAAETVQLFLTERNLLVAREMLQRLRVPFSNRVGFSQESVASTMPATISIVAIIPLILTLMTLTGAVYPAIDLTAGERERGTLESLIAAPLPRMRILAGKLVAVIVVALLTAFLNITGMLTTLWVFQMERLLFPDGGLRLMAFVNLFLLLIVFAGFFSSVLLAVTSFARSFKEGQAYVIPVMLLAIGPSLLSLKPDLNINGMLAVAPLVNIVLLAREVLLGSATLGSTIVVLGSTTIYSILAITFAARIFGTDSVLYGSSGSWKDLVSLPSQAQSVASESTAMLCLALLVPGTFLWNGLIARMRDFGVEVQFPLIVLGLVLIFGVIPLAITTFRRVRIVSGYALYRPHFLVLIAAVLLGIGLGPLLSQVIIESLRLQEWWFGESNNEALVSAAREQVAKWKLIPAFFLLPGLSIVPGIVEELFFRGCLFQSLRQRFRPWTVILMTAIIFGLFHLITAGSLGLSRFLPTMAMGIVLGYVCYRSGSVIPCMVLHSLHNLLTVSIVYYREDLAAAGWIDAEAESIPVTVLVCGAVASIVGFFLLKISRPDSSRTIPEESLDRP
ncbi:MAG TPA: ABC transporter permease subunit/CPBP intramembrane protease [Pirellulaceae bacterium]|nr:ABC transporter permease subunit/CPBP intramembrane protease [Pirellulaceae bacterium]HMO94036.1 ABC transporter permease subunit/CPBP intramembrane protease [Pirellulaceae bacterium]HMP70906.1 ABC transporter permease subunit/CPBP intramembrane protease [Pirellulaceae bacterium]